jgi:hypothetical protein
MSMLAPEESGGTSNGSQPVKQATGNHFSLAAIKKTSNKQRQSSKRLLATVY